MYCRIRESTSDGSPVSIIGTVSDPDRHVNMKYRLNRGADVPISVSSGAWKITVTPKQMVSGSNNLVVTATDSGTRGFT